MKVLVTGGSGFIGRATIEQLSKNEHTVINYDISNHRSILDRLTLEDFLGMGVDKCLHLAAVSRFDMADRDPLQAYELNVNGTKVVAKACAKFNIPLVLASTGSVYMPITKEPPIKEDFPAVGNSQYACSKAVAEQVVKKYSPQYIILRYGHVYGIENQTGLVGSILSRIARGIAPVIYGGQQSQDMVYVADVARANLLALEAPFSCWQDTYNISSGMELIVKDIIQSICKKFGWAGDISITPGRDQDATRMLFDISKAATKLGFEPEYTLEKGLEDMAELSRFKEK